MCNFKPYDCFTIRFYQVHSTSLIFSNFYKCEGAASICQTFTNFLTDIWFLASQHTLENYLNRTAYFIVLMNVTSLLLYIRLKRKLSYQQIYSSIKIVGWTRFVRMWSALRNVGCRVTQKCSESRRLLIVYSFISEMYRWRTYEFLIQIYPSRSFRFYINLYLLNAVEIIFLTSFRHML